MNREAWIAYAESVPLTPYQRGRLMHECDRLGLVDRTERLAVLAELLELDELESTADLTLGQAGRLVNLLQRTRDRAELPEITPAAADHGQDDEHGTGPAAPSLKPVTLADALGQIAIALWQIFGPGSEPPKSSDVPPASRESVSDE